MRNPLGNEAQVRSAWSDEMRAARTAHEHIDDVEEWTRLERAHILSQPAALLHIRTHAAMFAAALRRRDRHEIFGQLFRLLVAGPGSLTGRYPVGNTGGADVSAFQAMSIPDDLRVVLHDASPAKGERMEPTAGDTSARAATTFSTDTSGLEECLGSEVVELDDGDTFDLRIGAVVKQLGDDRVRMLSYNGSIPGPTLRVHQGSEVTVRVLNDADTEATVHWHGLCLDNKYDGVPYETQDPIPIGGDFTYRLRFPDAGLYWYHPHIREDYGLDMGLYGNILVEPRESNYWAPVNREIVVTLDDILIEDGKVAAYNDAGPTHVAMGRFGNVMLTRGETSLEDVAQAGEVVRFYFTNTANTRLFNVALRGARMKLVGGDSGRYERETIVEQVLLAPSERAILDVLFETGGSFPLEHRTPDDVYTLGRIVVGDEPTTESFFREFEMLRTSDEMANERSRIGAERDRAPDKTLAFKSLMPILYADPDPDTTVTAWTCPMHPEIVRSEPGTCPICGMKLVPAAEDAPAAEAHDASDGHSHAHDAPDGLEWEDLMPEINAATDATNMIWKLVDQDSGKENAEIEWAFNVGDQVKIRLVNDMNQEHPMHHPFHIHGAGRFLVLSRDHVPDPNLVWKDTVLVRSGENVDILLDVTNVGQWMAHCHIAEHNQSGMMFSFPVTEKA
jgi:FtsP/CotA-like multicopper oxidase with cupredoxin domain